MLDTLVLPFEVIGVFNAVKDIFDALPLVAKLVIISCFSVACLFCAMKMLF